jgi:hypothetical protein
MLEEWNNGLKKNKSKNILQILLPTIPLFHDSISGVNARDQGSIRLNGCKE